MSESREMSLVWPAIEYLDSYADALRQRWSPDNLRPETGQDELKRIETDPDIFIAQQVDLDGSRPPVILPDGSTAARIPGYRRWIWDGEFCGTIGFRWQSGTTELPPHCLGHIGYAVVPWKRQRGYATRALQLLIADLRSDGPHELPWVELTTQVSNTPSQRVIESNGGVVVETFSKMSVHGGGESLRYRIPLR